MKIWIVKLNSKLLTEYSRLKVPKGVIRSDSQQQQYSPRSSSSLDDISVMSEDGQIQYYNKHCLIKDVIEHSRKLPLVQYDKQLNYTRLRGSEYFYLCKYKLLFIYVLEDSQHSVLAIENILENVVKLYQEKCLSICNGYKLPNILTDYQREEMQKLSYKINDIVDQEENVNEFIRKESIRDPDDQRSNFVTEFGTRNRGLNEMTQREKDIRRKEIRYIYEIEKKVNRYRVKVFLLCLVIVIIFIVGVYFLFHGSCFQMF